MRKQYSLFPVLLLGLCAAAAPVFAQQDFPAQPPKDLPLRPFALPKSETRILPSGLKIVVAETHRNPIVTMRLAVRAGSVLDGGSPGLAAAVANQMTAGTDKYNSLQVRETAENIGGTLSAAATDDYATVSASALSSKTENMMALLADVLLHPAFPDSELGVYRKLTLQSLVLQRQTPAFLAGEAVAKTLYGAHPYGTVSTTSEAVKALTRDSIQSFYTAHYKPMGATLVIVGDIKPAMAFALVEKSLSDWKGGELYDQKIAPTPTRDTRKVYLVDRPGSVQSNIVIGNLALKRGEPDDAAFLLANVILGGSSGSRLFATVREKNGFAYSVSSTVDERGMAGSFLESAQTRTDVTAPAVQEMLKQAEGLRAAPVSDKELRAAKNYLTGNFVLRLTTQAGLADRLLLKEVYNLPDDYLQTFREKINSVTSEEVQAAAQKYMMPDAAAVIVVGDADKLRDSLKAIGDIEEIK